MCWLAGWLGGCPFLDFANDTTSREEQHSFEAQERSIHAKNRGRTHGQPELHVLRMHVLLD
jgi:hypothetical protein